MMALQSFPEGFWSVDISDVISALLSLALVILYWRMQKFQETVVSIQQKQAELMERQADFTQANHQPVLHSDDVTGEGQKVNLSLHNDGNGPAHGLLLQAVLYKQEEMMDGDPGEVIPGYNGSGSVIGPEWTPLFRESASEEDVGEEEEVLATAIREGEKSVSFESELKFTYMSPGSGQYDVTFTEAMDRISKEWDCDHIAIDFHIGFTDISGEWYGVPIGACGDIPVESSLTLDQALDDPQVGAPIGEPIKEDEVYSAIMLDDIEV
ncbi:hypothetical protein [Natronoarchaeum rubrum]|uniref:hypothetical protein n=1 Tax=Natronoarchaeum rubrum TaxID=755311 RepID=UPI0021122CEE|nr:hypothetical protein [Natronoarchaeum rubrum]